MRRTHEPEELYCSLHLSELDALLVPIQSKSVLPRDVVVLLTLLKFVDWRTGKAQLTVAWLAEQIGQHLNHTTCSLSRLRKAGVVARGRDKRSGGWFWMPNPLLFSFGSDRACAQRQREFEGLLSGH